MTLSREARHFSALPPDCTYIKTFIIFKWFRFVITSTKSWKLSHYKAYQYRNEALTSYLL